MNLRMENFTHISARACIRIFLDRHRMWLYAKRTADRSKLSIRFVDIVYWHVFGTRFHKLRYFCQARHHRTHPMRLERMDPCFSASFWADTFRLYRALTCLCFAPCAELPRTNPIHRKYGEPENERGCEWASKKTKCLCACVCVWLLLIYTLLSVCLG